MIEYVPVYMNKWISVKDDNLIFNLDNEGGEENGKIYSNDQNFNG